MLAGPSRPWWVGSGQVGGGGEIGRKIVQRQLFGFSSLPAVSGRQRSPSWPKRPAAVRLRVGRPRAGPGRIGPGLAPGRAPCGTQPSQGPRPANRPRPTKAAPAARSRPSPGSQGQAARFDRRFAPMRSQPSTVRGPAIGFESRPLHVFLKRLPVFVGQGQEGVEKAKVSQVHDLSSKQILDGVVPFKNIFQHFDLVSSPALPGKSIDIAYDCECTIDALFICIGPD